MSDHQSDKEKIQKNLKQIGQNLTTLSEQILGFFKKALIFIFSPIKNYLDKQTAIKQKRLDFKAGHLSPKQELEYIDDVLQYSGLNRQIKKFHANYSYYLDAGNNSSSLTVETVLKLIKNPSQYHFQTKGEQTLISEALSDVRVVTLVEQEKQKLIQELLPFSSDSDTYSKKQDSLFERQDLQRLKFYSQFEKDKQLDERELLAKHKDLEQKQKDLEHKHQEEKLDLMQLKLENNKILLDIESCEQELDYKKQLLELSKLSIDLQHREHDMKYQRQEYEILQLLSQLEEREREMRLNHKQNVLYLKEQGLKHEKTLQEAEYRREIAQQKEHEAHIENKLTTLREGNFNLQARQTLLSIRERQL